MPPKNIKLKLLHLTNGYPVKTLFSGEGVILCFHRIVSSISKSNGILEITEKRFIEIINYIKNQNFDFISIDQVKERLYQKNKRKFVVITFDDGYLDNYTKAFPILNKMNIPFTIYITTSFPEKQAILWWYIFEDIIEANDSLNYKIDDLHFNYSCKSVEEKTSLFNLLRKQTLALNHDKLNLFVKDMCENYSVQYEQYSEKLVMNWQNISEMAQNGLVIIGAHTVNHFPLKKLPIEIQQKEIFESQQIIQNNINQPVVHFSYPFGSKNEVGKETIEIIKKMGFETAVTTLSGNIFKEHLKYTHSLPRFFVNENTSLFFLRIILNGTYSFISNNYKKINYF